jgi:L-alanine-DL-glutamate epimerase-like enolase superfamily enzyme
MVAVLTDRRMILDVRGEEFEVRIVKAEAFLCDVEAEMVRTDAIQSFAKQETIFVDIEMEDGLVGTGYSYTIGTGGRAVLQLLRTDLLNLLVGGGRPED